MTKTWLNGELVEEFSGFATPYQIISLKKTGFALLCKYALHFLDPQFNTTNVSGDLFFFKEKVRQMSYIFNEVSLTSIKRIKCNFTPGHFYGLWGSPYNIRYLANWLFKE